MYSKKNIKKLSSDFRDDTLRANRFLNRDLFAWFAINRQFEWNGIHDLFTIPSMELKDDKYTSACGLGYTLLIPLRIWGEFWLSMIDYFFREIVTFSK